jgi:hypothetical protein
MLTGEFDLRFIVLLSRFERAKGPRFVEEKSGRDT